MSSRGDTVTTLIRDIKSGAVRDCEKAVTKLTELLKSRSANLGLDDLQDDSYHSIFEAVFSFVLREKPSLYDKKKSSAAESRLVKCASAVRAAVSRGLPKLGRKTLLAVIDHITQVTTGRHGEYIAPLMQNYVKALAEILSRQANVELLARREGSNWEVCVDYLLDVALHYLPAERDGNSGSGSRATPVPATTQARSALRSISSTQSQGRVTPQDADPLRDALEGLCSCIQAGNAPTHRRYRDAADIALRVLRLKYLSLGSLQTLSFAVINTLFVAIQAAEFDPALQMARDILPLMAYWWRAEKVSQDELIRALRHEILKATFFMTLHFEYLAVRLKEPQVISDLEDLADPLWTEYSKRSEAFRLQQQDISFCPEHLPESHFTLPLMGLRLHNVEGESFWAHAQCLASLETILHKSRATRSEEGAALDDNDDQPRKKRKTRRDMGRLHAKLQLSDTGSKRTALQVVPFMLASRCLGPSDTSALLEELCDHAGDKNPVTSSWALVACASAALSPYARQGTLHIWRQLWYLTTKLISLPSTCRAACLLIHNILEEDLIDYTTISADLTNIVTSADVSGPGLLCDTSIALMLHLLHVRNQKLPNASQSTSSHVIRWIFMRWNPGENSFASSQALHVSPLDLADLLRMSSGLPPLQRCITTVTTGGALLEAWKICLAHEEFSRYLLLLDDSSAHSAGKRLVHKSQIRNVATSDQSSHFATKKLILELLYPKLEEMNEVSGLWSQKTGKGGLQISMERFQSIFSACLTCAMLLPLFVDLNSSQSASVEGNIKALTEAIVSAAVDSVEPQSYINRILRLARPTLPTLSNDGLTHSLEDRPGLLRLIVIVGDLIDKAREQHYSGDSLDLMDLDGEFDSQSSRGSLLSAPSGAPRFNSQMSLDARAFSTETKLLLSFFKNVIGGEGQVGLVPGQWMDETLKMEDEDLLLCQRLLLDLTRSDLVMSADVALGVIQRLGSIIQPPENRGSEAALTTCAEAVNGLCDVWLNEGSDLSFAAGDMYHHLVKSCLPSNILSANCQISIVRLLLTLLKEDAEYASKLDLESCRTTLLGMLKDGPMLVKYFIAQALPNVFELYILMLHDDVFVDVLNSLPANPEDTCGIAFRLLVLSNLACHWATLLRRCTYHIFETPGKISQSMAYGRRCVDKISSSLGLGSPKDLFLLFSRQLLFTWLESDTIEDIPYSIFSFTSLEELLRMAQEESTGLLMMRGQEEGVSDLARRLSLKDTELLKANFTTSLTYAMIFDDSSGSASQGNSEEKLRRKFGTKAFNEAVLTNFVDMIALLLDLVDQEDNVEKVLQKHQGLSYASENMAAMKQIAHSPAKLPPNQQPTYRAKFVIHELFRICQVAGYELDDLWTASLVMSVARKLFNTVHTALGSLHACSVLRKVRILIALAGPTAYETQMLELLLNSMRDFIVDPECADDALGISQYLLTNGEAYVRTRPSFASGYALSTLAALRVFLESSQSSTTQESQFKATMGKAQKFHDWISRYLAQYESDRFKSTRQLEAFRSIMEAAARIRTFGSAEKDTAESKLLLDILGDEASPEQLLDKSSRQVALGLLCGDFLIPEHRHKDILGSDQDAVRSAASIWKSCQTKDLGQEYRSWAGRVLGRSFAASGRIPDGVLRESSLTQYMGNAPGNNNSESAILGLLQGLTASPRSIEAGLAEAALRRTVSKAVELGDEPLVIACQKSLSEGLFAASQWGALRSPPSEQPTMLSGREDDSATVWTQDISSIDWLSKISLHLARAMRNSILLAVLPPVLSKVSGFAEQAFPFLLHLVLYFELEHQQTIKRSLSSAMREWLSSSDDSAIKNQKLLINSILYLRTQEYPKESSIVDRLQWLDIDFNLVATAASRCGLHKTALLFAEIAKSETRKPARRSSASSESDNRETLLRIFENIDDPDAYYGVAEEASLSSILTRAEYENDGMKRLAFRGAQYDTLIRTRDPGRHGDALALVQSLNSLGHSGLSHSLLQTQQGDGSTQTSIEDTYHTARKLEIWNLAAPAESDHHAVAVYKAYQSMHQASGASITQTAIHDGYSTLMGSLVGKSLSASAVRKRLAALASLCELDDVLNIQNFEDLDTVVSRFGERCDWMNSGLYADVCQILSSRGTTMSMLAQHTNMLKNAKLPVGPIRQLQIKSLLVSSNVYRHHQAFQESLNISTTLTHLIRPCEKLHVHVDAVVNIEAANSLWDHGEMGSSIKMLQAISNGSPLKKQAIEVSRADLLSKIGHKMSVARLEKPHDIQKNYLEPALKELKGKSEGKDAGAVYHQFAVFCDNQLQDPDGLEDLARLRGLKQGKSEEVAGLKSLISGTRDPQLKQRYNHILAKEKQWLELDEKELRRVEETRSEFVRLSLESYLLSLMASDEHNADALRFTALWLERSEENTTNKAVARYLPEVPTYKFATLVNQLTSRLQNQDDLFQSLLMDLVFSICRDHPYHGMYQIWSGTKAKAQQSDEVALLRVKANEKVAQKLAADKTVGKVWTSVEKGSKYYHLLAMDRNQSKYKSGSKIALKDSAAATNLVHCFARFDIPPPTMHVEISPTRDYSQVPKTAVLEPSMSIASGVSAPKIITAVVGDGTRYKQLVKGGHDDLRQDAIMEQVFSAVSSLLKQHRSTRQRSLGIRTYKVLPLTATSGIIEFVPNTIPLHEFLMPAHERYYPKDLKGSQCRKDIYGDQSKSVEKRVETYRKVTARFHPVMRYFFMENFVDPDDWFARRQAYARSTAAISMLGHVLGLGDRHGHNILLDNKTGEAVHIDLGVAFEAGRILPVPELVPFRLTRDIVDGMGITKTEGVFRRCCEFTLDALREEQHSIMTILDVLRYDPLYTWSVSPLRLAKLQKARHADEGSLDDTDQREMAAKTGQKNSTRVNEPSEADRALEVVRKKLSKTLSVTATVNDLINQATDERNLAVLYSGWAAYA